MNAHFKYYNIHQCPYVKRDVFTLGHLGTDPVKVVDLGNKPKTKKVENRHI